MAETFTSTTTIGGTSSFGAPAPGGGAVASGVRSGARLEVGDGSGTYESRVSIGGGLSNMMPPAAPAAPEVIVKSFFEAFKDRRDQRLEQLREPPGVEETASICWGKAQQLPQSTTNPTQPDKFGQSVSVTSRKPDEPPKVPDKDKPIRLRERYRYVEKIKVTAEDDKSVFVMVERMRAWLADGSDGKKYILEFNPKGPKAVLTEGEKLPI